MINLKFEIYQAVMYGVRVLEISLGSLTESFIKIQQKEACQDFTYPQNLLLESWRTGMCLIEWEMESGY